MRAENPSLTERELDAVVGGDGTVDLNQNISMSWTDGMLVVNDKANQRFLYYSSSGVDVHYH
jgi:hypothetical protein